MTGTTEGADPLAPSARAIEAAWSERVCANRDQVDRVREVADERDFYAPTSSLFRADPLRTDDPVLDTLVALTRPEDVWLDIGAGAGRFALPIALRVREVIALDPSAGMLDGLRAGMTEYGIGNIRVLEGRWPEAADGLRADVALIAHVGYDIDAIGAFVDAIERAAARLCVAVLMDRAPAALADPFWAAVHGEHRVPLPALPEFLALLLARGMRFELRRVPSPPRRWAGSDDALRFLRQQLWVAPDGEADGQLRALVDALPRDRSGGVQLLTADRDIGVVTWRPE